MDENTKIRIKHIIEKETQNTINFLIEKTDGVDVNFMPAIDDFSQNRRITASAILTDEQMRIGTVFMALSEYPVPSKKQIRQQIAQSIAMARHPWRNLYDWAHSLIGKDYVESPDGDFYKGAILHKARQIVWDSYLHNGKPPTSEEVKNLLEEYLNTIGIDNLIDKEIRKTELSEGD